MPEFVLGISKDDELKDINSKIKRAFTRRYNSMSHTSSGLHLLSDMKITKKKIKSKDKSNGVNSNDSDDDDDEEEEIDLTKFKKSKSKSKTKTKTKRKRK